MNGFSRHDSASTLCRNPTHHELSAVGLCDRYQPYTRNLNHQNLNPWGPPRLTSSADPGLDPTITIEASSMVIRTGLSASDWRLARSNRLLAMDPAGLNRAGLDGDRNPVLWPASSKSQRCFAAGVGWTGVGATIPQNGIKLLFVGP